MKGTAFAQIQNELVAYSELRSLNAGIIQAYPLEEDIQTLQDQKIYDLLQKVETLLKKAPRTKESQILMDFINASKSYLKEKTETTKENLKHSLIILFDFVIKETEELKLQIKVKLIEKGNNTLVGVFLCNALAVLNEAHGFFREIIERDYNVDQKLFNRLLDRYLAVLKSISKINDTTDNDTLDAIADSQMGLNKMIRTARAGIGIKPIVFYNWQSEVMSNAVLGHS